MKAKILIAIVVAVVTSLVPINAQAEWNGFSMLRDCKNTPNKPCIVEISAITKDGNVIPAVLTGRVAIGDGTAPANIDDEYQLPGLSFEFPAGNKMIPRIFYDGTMFQTVFEAGWLDQTTESRKNFEILSPHRSSNLNCGTAQNLQICYRNINFNQDLTFHEVLRIPQSFVTAYVNARTDYIQYKTNLNPVVIEGTTYSSIDLTIHVTKKAQVAFSDVQPNPLATSNWADSEIDQTIANFYSSQSPISQRLGVCSGLPAISVISNGLNPELPSWDPVTKTMSVSVSGPHYKVNGDLNSGFFQARISKGLARCLWNLDVSSQTKAQITLTDQGTDGADTIETLSGNFDGEDYVLTDSNFHYSSPLIKWRLFNESQPITSISSTPQVTASPSVSPNEIGTNRIKSPSNQNSTAGKSWTCVQGSKIKKFTGSKISCPKGYSIKK